MYKYFQVIEVHRLSRYQSTGKPILLGRDNETHIDMFVRYGENRTKEEYSSFSVSDVAPYKVVKNDFKW